MRALPILTAPAFGLTVQRLCRQLVEDRGDLGETALVGLHPRGVYFSRRLRDELVKITGNDAITYGELDMHTRQELLNGGIGFEIAGAQLDRNSLSLDAGLDLALSASHTLGMGVTGDIASDSRNTGVMGQWRMAF